MKKDKYLYTLFGQRVASEIVLPEVSPWLGGTAAAADITVELGTLPPAVRQAIESRGTKWIGIIDDGDFWFVGPGGHYYVTGGNHILVDPSTAEDEMRTRLFLLGSAMGIALIQRGLMPVHGSAVTRGGQVVVVGGQSGAGKSTVAGALLQQPGVRFLADDVSTVEIRPDGVWVLPAYPQRKLCRDAALAQGYDLDQIIPIDTSRDKYAISSAENWCNEPGRLGAIVEIIPDHECSAVTLEQIRGYESLGYTIRNLYRSFVHTMLGMKPERMKRCLTIASQAPIYLLRRPQGQDSLDQVVETILPLL